MKTRLREALSALQNDETGRIGPYGAACLVLTIKDLFQMLPRRTQEDLVDTLVGIVTAKDPAVPANRVGIPGDHGGAPAASGSTEPCEGSRRVIHKSSP